MRRPNNSQQPAAKKAGAELGLSDKQMSVINFGYHTVNAIKVAMEQGVSLEDAYAKYRHLDIPRVSAMRKLNLSREQVLAPNFGYHTINAIEVIQKRTRELSSTDVFEMVKKKSCNETKKIVDAYLESTKKTQKPINEMALIRVVVNTGRGFGHQRAAITLMQKLRELGFKGVFDIQCNDRVGGMLLNSKTGESYINEEPLVSRQLINMIPSFESAEPDKDGVRIVSGLGQVKIASLPNNYESRGDLGLPQADLAVCAAEDSGLPDEATKVKKFNATSYIGLEPTDWYQGSCFVTDSDGIVKWLPPASTMRLTSAAACQLLDVSSIPLSATEQRIINIISNMDINSQLVYGLYPAMHYSFEDECMKETGNIAESIEMQRIIEANHLLRQKTGKPSLLLLPQSIAMDKNFIKEIKGINSEVRFIDLTVSDFDTGVFKECGVIVAYTGSLQQPVFDYLMLMGTTLPPVIEGCNSREACEFAGKPFIHGSARHYPLKQYKVEASDKQTLHTQASLCLMQGDAKYVSQLVQYMYESLTSNTELLAYHKQRQQAFLTRPDACEVALNELGIPYEKESQKLGLSAERERFFSSQKPDSSGVSHKCDQQFELK